MSETDSVIQLLDGLRTGNDRDIARLWDRYFARLVRLAGARLGRRHGVMLDAEDAALSAFRSFCDRAGRGDFPRLAGRDDLWRVLATITTRKVISALRYENRQKRGGGRVHGESAFGSADDGVADGIAQVLSREPTPEAAAEFADAYERLFARLSADPVLETIAERRLDGKSSETIGAELGLARRTVDRKLALIRALWEEGDAP